MAVSAASMRRPPPLHALGLILLASAGASLGTALSGQTAPPPMASAAVTSVQYADVRPIVDRLAADLPEALNGRTPEEVEALWPAWVERRNAAIRARVEQGDEDSLVNLWLFGTTFTGIPPVRAGVRGAGISTADLLEGRLNDLLDGIASPGRNERLRFARELVEGRDIDPAAPPGREQVRHLLVTARKRVIAENQSTDQVLAEAKARGGADAELAAHATIFQKRGLSSDTSVLPGFGVEQALAGVMRSGALAPGSVRRVGIIGPGLDVINKADGHDFYPPQTIQPFALVDSLIRLRLAGPGEVRVITLDVSPRVNRHLEDAGRRAQDGTGYVVHLPLDMAERWTAPLVEYWEQWGERIGERVPPPAPRGASLRSRAVRVHPAVVASVRPRDVNIVVERVELPAEERLDLVIATNILVYYDRFEQAVALANIGAMLRPGGSLLSNTPLAPAAPMKSSAGYMDVLYSDRQFDRFFWYQRQ